LDVDTLKNVAAATGGIYAHAADRQQLNEQLKERRISWQLDERLWLW